ncbi:MAG: ABC transporter substrate-binding protein [Candidatus Bathyarchaeia archaeon]
MDKHAITKVQVAIIVVMIVIVAIIAGVVYYPVGLRLAPAESIKIGVTLPLTGMYSKIGEDLWRGFAMAIEEINEKGGILGRHVDVIIIDNEGSTDKVVSAVRRFIDIDKVHIIAGIFTVGNVFAVQDMIAESGIPYLCLSNPGPTALFLQDPQKFRNFFTMHAYYNDEAKLFVTIAREIFHAKSYVYLAEDFESCRRNGEYQEIFAREAGINLIEKIFVAPGSKDFTSEIIRIEQLNPDVLAHWVWSGAEFTFYKQMYERRFPIPHFTILSIVGMPQFSEWIGVDVSNYMVSGTWIANVSMTENTIPFCNKYYKKYGILPAMEAAQTYEGAYLLKAAIEKAGTTDPNAVIQALEEVEIIGIRGRVRMDARTHHPIYLKPGYIMPVVWQWKNGKPYVIYPKELAQKEFEKAPWWK